MKNNLFALSGIFIICASVSCTMNDQKKSDTISGVRLTVLNSLERIGQVDELSGKDEAVIKAAKNEYESFQVVVGAGDKNIRVIRAEMSDLTGDAGTIGKENITLFREEYTRVRQSSELAQLAPGLYPDPLVPFINQVTGKLIEPFRQERKRWGDPMLSFGYQMYGIPFQVWKGQNQPLWVDVHIPANAAAGEYSGTFTVEMSKSVEVWGAEPDILDNTVYTIPVHLTVWDFTLPDGPTHSNHFGSFRDVAKVFGVAPSSTAFDSIEMEYCKMMAQHRLNPPLPQSILPEVNPDGSLRIDPARTEALTRFINDLHLTDFEIPRAPFHDMTTANRDKATRYYQDYWKYLQNNGWDKMSYLYMWDEPNLSENYQMVNDLGELVHNAVPAMKILVVEQPYTQDPSWPTMDKAIDIWCPLFGFLDRDSTNHRIAQGDEVWSYTALSQRTPQYHPEYEKMKSKDSPYWHIDALLTSYRTPTWMNYQYNVTGLLYWSVVTITRTAMGVSDPWFSPSFNDGGGTFNGGGHLMYPGIPCGIRGPVSCIRFKNIRESMEDYEYLALLEKQAGREAVLNFVNEIAPNWWETSEDPEQILAVRERLALEILKGTKK